MLFALYCNSPAFMLQYTIAVTYESKFSTRAGTRQTALVKKIPPRSLQFSDIFKQTVEKFKSIFLHTYYTFLSTLDYKFLFSYLKI